MALLSYNSHTIQFTRLKYTIQWLSAYTQDWATSATISFKIFSLPPKEVLLPIPYFDHQNTKILFLTKKNGLIVVDLDYLLEYRKRFLKLWVKPSLLHVFK